MVSRVKGLGHFTLGVLGWATPAPGLRDLAPFSRCHWREMKCTQWERASCAAWDQDVGPGAG